MSAPIPKPSEAHRDIEDESDQDYQAMIKPAKRQKEDQSKVSEDITKPTRNMDVLEASEHQLEQNTDDMAQRDEAEIAQSDADWLRSRTSRLLGLLDEDEEERYMSKQDDEDASKSPDQQTPLDEPQQASECASNQVSNPEKQQEDATPVNADEQAIRKSKRLFLRNLPYSATEDDLRERFECFGGLEEVRTITFVFQALFSVMISDRDNLCCEQ